MGRSDYFADGQWNFFCDFCGAKEKSSNGIKTWNGYYVCRSHREVRNPQDFVRGIKDNQSVPWTRPEPTDTFAPITYTRQFDDAFGVAETVAKLYRKNISPPQGTGTLNAFALNAAVLDGPGALTAADLEKLSLSEMVKLTTGKTVAEALPLAETVSFRLVALRSLNGAALNSFALG